MSSPAQRYAEAAARAAFNKTAVHGFASLYEFDLDPFQLNACASLESGRGVLVAAPTGSGKTVVGEFAVHLALEEGGKCFYTAPIKALSNQKFNDLVDRYGPERVGLLTGDNSINGDAPVVVMTTEVLRNMLYADSHTLEGLRYVVMDEVHYLADRMRGAVWEEVIIHLPEHVTLVALSATVSNAEEFGDWLATVRGDTDVVVEEHRPVPLWQHVMADSRLHDLFIDDAQSQINTDLIRIARDEHRIQRLVRHGGSNRPQRGGRRPSPLTPLRYEVIERLDREGLLPAITFIFSRTGCDAAVEQILSSGLKLTDAHERRRIAEVIEDRCAHLPEEDLNILGFGAWRDGLERGIASHHAGLLPTFKEVVEQLFQEGLLKVVYATETLALGINMPARSVVLEKLVKWNGETHADISPGEYTQLTGRAGRRGIDVEGHAVVVWHQGIDPESLAGLASTRTYPLRSSFRPSYNMTVNLIARFGRHTSRELLETSFAQFQADRGVVGLARQVRRNEEALEGYHEGMTCHLGDFHEYFSLRDEITRREKDLTRTGTLRRKQEVVESLVRLKPGDIVLVPQGRRAGPAVILDVGLRSTFDDPRPLVLTMDRQVRRLSSTDFTGTVEPLLRVRIPAAFNARSAKSRRDLAAVLRDRTASVDLRGARKDRSAAADDARLVELRRLMRAHPCHGCNEREDHARWAERHGRLQRETQGLAKRVENRTNSIAAQFDRVCEVLAGLDYLTSSGDDAQVTDAGRRLARLYSELDLLAAECLRSGIWDGLNEAELAAVCSALVFESRGDDEGVPPKIPTARISAVLNETTRIHADLAAREREAGLSFLRDPDLGFATAAYRWTSGHRLDAVLREADLAPGDFVRWCRQLIDLLGQVAEAAEITGNADLGRTARAAVSSLRRGVVSYSSVG
jgi:ATP-dependent RNA helicase HelY